LSIRLVLALLVVIGGAFASSPAQTWRIGDDQPFPTHITALSDAKRSSILQNLDPALLRLAKDFDLKPSEIVEAKKSLLLTRIETSTGPLLLIQGWGSSMCGATGNCAVWAMGNNDRLILEAGAYKIRVLPLIHHGLPSILTFTSPQTDGSELVWYSFDGSRYRAVSCATETYGTLTMTDTKRRVTHHPCGR
jgi:hypothetical protein